MRGSALIFALLVTGCGDAAILAPLDSPPIGVPSLNTPALTGSLAWADAGLHVDITVTNPTMTRGYVTIRNPCTVVVEYYDSDLASARKVWDERLYLHGCKSFDYYVVLRPHERRTFTSLHTPVAAILGDSLPPGRYWTVAVVVLRQVPGEVVRVSLGSLDLGS